MKRADHRLVCALAAMALVAMTGTVSAEALPTDPSEPVLDPFAAPAPTEAGTATAADPANQPETAEDRIAIETAPPAPVPAQPRNLAIAGALEATIPKNDDGRHVALRWDGAAWSDGLAFIVMRGAAGATVPVFAPNQSLAHASLQGDWTVVSVVEGGDGVFTDEIAQPKGSYRYAVVLAETGAEKDIYPRVGPAVVSAEIKPASAVFNTDRWFFLAVIVMMGVALFFYMDRAKRNPREIFIRRIPGVDAIEEAVGRSTEMGRPVLYVTGVEEIQNIQTIASLLILGHVAQMTAEYDTDIKVANFFPLTMVVAEEIVRQGYANAGRIDAHRPENCMFISAEQFAFAAGVNGLILRDKPATNIYLGRFFAESLILAETGFITKAIQIAGTAEITQLPFFIAACDYTIIGEELYAVSAYLSREPTLLATLKATDLLKVIIIATVAVGTILATAGVLDIGPVLIP